MTSACVYASPAVSTALLLRKCIRPNAKHDGCKLDTVSNSTVLVCHFLLGGGHFRWEESVETEFRGNLWESLGLAHIHTHQSHPFMPTLPLSFPRLAQSHRTRIHFLHTLRESRDLDVRHGGGAVSSLAGMSGGGGGGTRERGSRDGGREREREVHIRGELPPHPHGHGYVAAAADHRGGGGGSTCHR